MKIVRSRLKHFVNERNQTLGFEITAAQLAEAIGVSRPAIYTWLSDKPIERLDIEVLSKLAEYFGCSLWDMLEVENGGQESPEKTTHPDGELEQVA